MTVTFYRLDVEDKPGTLGQVATVLSKAGVNIEAFSVDRSGVRILTNDPAATTKALGKAKISYEAYEVIEIELPNKVGELARVATALGKHKVNIVTSFGMASSNDGGRIYISPDDVDAAWDALEGMH
jgi:hypothetical protein